MRCKDCEHFKEIDTRIRGDCYRYPPTVLGPKPTWNQCARPNVESIDKACGEFSKQKKK